MTLLIAGVSIAALLVAVRRRIDAERSLVQEPPAARWSRRDWVLLATIGALALLLRARGLGDVPLDQDESFAGVSPFDWRASYDARLHPPLHPAMLWLLARGDDDVVLARLPSVIAGVAVVLLAYGLVRRAAATPWAAAGALFLALSPAAIHPAQLARGYALLALLVLAAHAALGRALRSPRGPWFELYALSVALALATEYIALAPLAADAIITARSSRATPRRAASVLLAFIAGCSAVAFLAPVAATSVARGVGPGDLEPTGVVGAALATLDAWSGAVPWLGALPILVLIAAGLRATVRTDETRLAVQIGAIALAMIAGGALTAVRARYALHALPLLVVLAASVAPRVGPRLRFATTATWALSHLAALPLYFAFRGRPDALRGGVALPGIVAQARGDPELPIAVLPHYEIAEPAYRLAGVVPRPGAGGCPVARCAPERSTRRFYGLERAADLARLPEQRVLLLVSSPRDAPPGCEPVARELEYVLYRCTLGDRR